jgi:hypothetical protein
MNMHGAPPIKVATGTNQRLKMKTARKVKLDKHLAAEAKSMVVLAFRNGPIEDIHAGRECPTCAGKVEYSHITQDEMKRIMKRAVDKVYALLWIRTYHPEIFQHVVRAGNLYSPGWDLPENSREEIEFMVRGAELFGTARKLDAPEPKAHRRNKI